MESSLNYLVYKSYFDKVPDGIFITDENGKFVDVNYAAEKLLGRPSEEILTKSVNDLIHEDYREQALRIFNETKKNGVASDIIGVKDFEGNKKYWNIYAIKTENNGYFGIVKDVTEEKEAKNMYNMLADNVTDMITLHDRNGSYIYVSPASKTLLGYEPNELTGKNPYDFFHPDDIPVVNKSHELVLSENPITIEYRFKGKDGIYRWMETNNKMIKNSITNEVEIIICITRNIDQSKLVQDELKESIAMFKAISNYSHNAICIVNASGHIIWANQAVEDIAGYKVEQLLKANSFIEFIAPESKEHLIQDFSKFKENKEYERHGEFYFLRADGAKRLCEKHMSDFVDKSGNRSIAVSMLDITELRNAELSLSESERKFRTLAETSSAGVFIHNGENFEYFNQTIIDTTGFSSEELSKMFFIDLVFPDDREMVLDYWKKRRSGEIMPDFYESRMCKKGGGFIWANISAKLIILNDKPCLIGTAFDITNSKKIEEQLIAAKEKAEESEYNLKEAQKIAKVGHWYWSLEKNELAWSDEIFNIFGQSKDTFEVSSENFEKTIHPDDLDAFLKQRDAAFSNNQEFSISHRIIRPDNSIGYVEERARLLKDSNGNIVKVFGTVQDVTEKKQLEEQLIFSKEKAEESDRLKSSFLKNLSHEIRTPMNAIMGFSEFINDPEISAQQRREYTNIITESCQQLLSIVTDVLSISSIDTGLETVKHEPVNIASTLKDLLIIFKNQAEKKKLSISSLNLSGNDSFAIASDETKLKQILANLIGNAIKFTHEGSIVFGFDVKDNNIEFFVKDTGIGIVPELHEKVFERFRQADLTISRKYGGTGLGLSISKALAELLGGNIRVESEPNIGSTFYFTIPYNPITITNISNDITQLSSSLDKIILIAEDEDHNFMLIEEMLKASNFKIIRANTGTEAVNIFMNQPVDLILMDIRMPDMNGYEATEMIKTINPDIPIIVQSAYSLQVEIKKAIEKGANDYIVKPIDKNNLFELINKYL